MDKSTVMSYWFYFLNLEHDFEETARYVEHTFESVDYKINNQDYNHSNKYTYSIEFAKIIMSTCAEVDILLRELCKIVRPESLNSCQANIHKYGSIILSEIPKIIETNTTIRGRKIYPWMGWKYDGLDSRGHHIGTAPEWWRNYNNIKHNRASYYKSANLITSIESLSALLILNIYLHYYNNMQPYPSPKYIDCSYLAKPIFTAFDMEIPTI